MRFLMVVVLLAGCALFASLRPAAAQPWLDQPGIAGAQRIAVGRAVVTLPPGQWIVAEADTHHNPGQSNSSFDRRLYIQTIGGGIHAAALVEAGVQAHRAANSKGQLYGWSAPVDCRRKDVFFFDDPDTRTGYFDCLTVNHQTMAPSRAQPWFDAAGMVGQYGGWPRPMVVASFAMSGPRHEDVLIVKIFVDPALAGFPGERMSWADSAWHPTIISADRRAYENKVAAWAKAYRPILEASWN